MADIGIRASTRACLNQKRELVREATDKEGYNILFYGPGKVAFEGMKAILSSSDLFYLPVKEIHLVGRGNEASANARELKRIESSIIGFTEQMSAKPDIINHIDEEELSDLIPTTDILFFTADKNKWYEGERIRMIGENVPLVKRFTEIFNQNAKKFNGIINFVSNLSEALAHYAACNLNVRDIRQITANPPLDLIRYQYEIFNRIYADDNFKPVSIDATLGGFHNLPLPIVNGTEISYGLLDRPEGRFDLRTKIDERIRKIMSHKELTKILKEFGPRQMKYLLTEMQARYGDNFTEQIMYVDGPTTSTSGRAIRELVRAIVNREDTTISIPQKYDDGKWYFALRPVDLSRGYPLLDEQRFARFTDEDKEQDRDRIIGEWDGDPKNMPLRTILEKSEIQGDGFEIAKPSAYATLEKIFNPTKRRVSRPIVKKVEFTSHGQGHGQIMESIDSIVKKQLSMLMQNGGIAGQSAEHVIEGTIYYVDMIDNLFVVNGLSLPEANPDNKQKFKFEVAGKERRYNDNVGLRKIIRDGDKLIVEGLYSHEDEKGRSHFAWFDAKNGKKQGFIKPEIVKDFHFDDKNKTPIELLHIDEEFMDTTAFFNDKFYFIIANPMGSEQLVEYDVKRDDYKIIGKGTKGSESLVSIIAMEDDIILGGENNFYRLHKDRLKHIGKSMCTPVQLKSLRDENIVMYTNPESGSTYSFNLGNPGEVSEFKEGNIFDVYQNDEIILATIDRGRIQASRYKGADSFMKNKEEPGGPLCSPTTDNIVKIIVPNHEVIIGISETENDMIINFLNSSNLHKMCPEVTIKNACNLLSEFYIK